MISMIKWQCHSCYYHYSYYYYFLLLLSLFLLSLLFSWCAVLMHMPGLRDPVVMRCCPISIGRLLRALVCLRQTAHSVMLTTACRRHLHSAENEFRWHQYRSALSVDCWSIRSGKYPWCSDLVLCGKNESTFCAANLQVVTRGCHVVAFLAET